jgi:GNAT superfamily N-acetyltransferase
MHGERPFTVTRGTLICSSDVARLPRDDAYALLRTTKWAAAMPRELFERAVDGAVCFGVYDAADRDRLVGFSRVITDLATFAYWSDVVVSSETRGRGVGKFLVESMLAHPQLTGFRRTALLTEDAQGLYAQYGFSEDTGYNTYMERRGTLP